jgi:hypothetical protein
MVEAIKGGEANIERAMFAWRNTNRLRLSLELSNRAALRTTPNLFRLVGQLLHEFRHRQADRATVLATKMIPAVPGFPGRTECRLCRLGVIHLLVDTELGNNFSKTVRRPTDAIQSRPLILL